MTPLIEFIIGLIEQARLFVTIQPWERGVWVTGGKWVRTLNPGIHLTIPFLTEIFTSEVIEQVVDFRCITCLTKDQKNIAISPGLSYVISDVRQAYENVKDWDESIETLVLGVTHKYINARTLNDCLDTEDIIKCIQTEVRRYAKKWGIEVVRVWITDTGTRYTRIIAGSEGLVNIMEGE